MGSPAARMEGKWGEDTAGTGQRRNRPRPVHRHALALAVGFASSHFPKGTRCGWSIPAWSREAVWILSIPLLCLAVRRDCSKSIQPGATERGARVWLRPRAMGGGSSPHLVLSLTANPTVDSHGASRPGSLCPGGDKGSTGQVLAIEPSPAVSRQLGPRVGKWHKLSQGRCCPCKCSRLCPRMADFFFFLHVEFYF